MPVNALKGKRLYQGERNPTDTISGRLLDRKWRKVRTFRFCRKKSEKKVVKRLSQIQEKEVEWSFGGSKERGATETKRRQV